MTVSEGAIAAASAEFLIVLSDGSTSDAAEAAAGAIPPAATVTDHVTVFPPTVCDGGLHVIESELTAEGTGHYQTIGLCVGGYSPRISLRHRRSSVGANLPQQPPGHRLDRQRRGDRRETGRVDPGHVISFDSSPARHHGVQRRSPHPLYDAEDAVG